MRQIDIVNQSQMIKIMTLNHPGSEKLKPSYIRVPESGIHGHELLATNGSIRIFGPSDGYIRSLSFMYIGCLFYNPVCTFLKIKNISLLMLMIMMTALAMNRHD